MTRLLTTVGMSALLAMGALTLPGCEQQVAHQREVEVDGDTVEERETTVTETPDGDIKVKKETTTKEYDDGTQTTETETETKTYDKDEE